MSYKKVNEQLNFLRDIMFKYVWAYRNKETEFDPDKDYGKIEFNLPIKNDVVDIDYNSSYDLDLVDVLFDILNYEKHVNLIEWDTEFNVFREYNRPRLLKKLEGTKTLLSVLTQGECPLPLTKDIVFDSYQTIIDVNIFNSYTNPMYLMLYHYISLKSDFQVSFSNELLVGTYDNGTTEYIIALRQTKSYSLWYLFSKYHKDDITDMLLGNTLKHNILSSPYDVIAGKHLETKEVDGKKTVENNYLLGAYKQMINGTASYFGNLRLLKDLLNLTNLARNYSFKTNSINTNIRDIDKSGVPIVEFSATDESLSYTYKKHYMTFNLIDIKYNQQSIKLDIHADSIRFASSEDFQPVPDKVIASAVKDVDFSLLQNMLDLSWYIDENGNKLKDYREINTKIALENMLSEFIDEYNACVERNEKIILSMDTETDGLNICNLSPGNPYKNTCCAIPIAFKDNQSFVILTNMEYFDNIPNEYVWHRLKPLFERDLSDKANNLFSLEIKNENGEVIKSAWINRDNIILVGHNVMFDGKVAYDNKVQPEWDEDTLQMAFNINPTIIRGNNGLKNLAKKLLGREAPELTDMLGKGNEDKYRLLRDIEVVKLYGCADADNTREVYKELLRIMPPEMYASYKERDIPMLNRLYVSEYNGLRMEEDKVKLLAESCKKDLEAIQEFLYDYVGKFIYIKDYKSVLQNSLKSGAITQEQFNECASSIDLNKAKPYIFDMKGSSYQQVLYNILNYPILGYTSENKPKTDKKVLKMLASKKGTPFLKISSDLPVYNEKGESILTAKKMNEVKYPVALILQEYSALNKEYTSYFKPIIENNLEGKLFKSYSLTRIETRRIMNPSQTMKGSLKQLTIPYSDDYYLVDFDMSQVEYRIMIALANFIPMINKMKDSEKDFHTETASMVHEVPAHKVSKKLRKGTKNVSFGIPYGLGDVSLCINMHGDSSPAHMYETAKLLDKFKTNNKPVIDMIEGYRDNAMQDWYMPDAIRDYIGAYKLDDFGNKHAIRYGRVTNPAGYHRLFDLTGTPEDKRRVGVIRRAAGNYPIQSYAAELFRTILLNFYYRCVKEGIADKCLWHMLIHDELLLSVHKSINPFLIFKIVYEECMLPLTTGGDPFYFCGINLGRNWGECKDDASEAPVKFVERIVKRYDAGEFDGLDWFDDAKGFVDKYRKEYLIQRIYEVLKEIQPDIDTAPINFELILKNLSNYTVRAYITDFFVPPMNKKRYKDLSDDAKLFVCLEYWAFHYFGEGKPILLEGKILSTKVRRDLDISNIYTGNKDEDIEEQRNDLVDDEYWSTDDNYIDIDLEDGLVFNEDTETFSKNTDIANLISFEKYQRKYVSKINNTVYIKVPLSSKLEVKKLLRKYLAREGRMLFLGTVSGNLSRIGYIDSETNLDELDKEIGGLINGKANNKKKSFGG